MAAPRLGHCHDLIMCGICPALYSDGLVPGHCCVFWLESPLLSARSNRSVISQTFKHSLFTALASSWRDLVTCCLLMRLNEQCSKADCGWLSSGSSPYPGGGLQFDIERFHPEAVLSIFPRFKNIKTILSLNFLGLNTDRMHCILSLDHGAVILSRSWRWAPSLLKVSISMIHI